MYDWGNSAFFTTVVTAVFPLYFVSIAAPELSSSAATAAFGYITTIALFALAALAPLLGAVADYSGARKRFLAAFMLLGVLATASLYFVDSGDWRLGMVLFGIANVGASGSLIFYDALLPHVAERDETHRLSTVAYAAGYLGGGILLAVQLVVILNPGMFGLPEGTLPTRLVLVSVAVWWVAFSLPILRRVPEPPRISRPGDVEGTPPLRAGVRRLTVTIRELRRYRHALLMMGAYLVYADGIGTVFRMAGIFAAEQGFETGTIIGALLLTQFIGVPCAIGFGFLAHRIGAKASILGALVVYVLVCLLGSQLETAGDLYLLAAAVALVQGGTQALSRSLFASMIPTGSSGEFFGVLAVCEKVAGVVGPLAFAVVTDWTGSSRYAVMSVAVFFVVGGLMLWRVDVEAGRDAVRD